MQRLDFDPLNPPPAGQVREQAVGATAKRANGDGSLDGDEARLAERIVALSRHEYEKGRKGIAKEEGVTVRYLDGLREFTSRSAEPESPSLFPKVDPWPEPVAGAELLDLLRHSLERFVVFTEYGAATVALWVLAAWSVEAFLIAPYLAIISPEKRCGKTTLMEILGRFVPLPLKTSNITPAALFRAVEKFRCSLLIDEADSFLDRKSKASGRDELRGILNAGHSRASAYVIRTVGEDHEPVVFNVFGPKAIACIGQLPDTIEDRSIVIRLRRRGAGEKVERHRIDRGYEFAGLARKCARWAQDHVEALRAADPETPAALHDRAADNWRPLLAVANSAGGAWLWLAVAAAKGLTQKIGRSHD